MIQVKPLYNCRCLYERELDQDLSSRDVTECEDDGRCHVADLKNEDEMGDKVTVAEALHKGRKSNSRGKGGRIKNKKQKQKRK